MLIVFISISIIIWFVIIHIIVIVIITRRTVIITIIFFSILSSSVMKRSLITLLEVSNDDARSCCNSALFLSWSFFVSSFAWSTIACAVAWPLIVVFPTVLVWLSSMERSCDAGTRFRRFAEAWSMAGTAAVARSVSSFLESILRPPSHIFIAANDWEIVSSQRRRKAWAAWLRMTFACASGSCASEHAPSLFVLRHEPQNVW